ncbi:MAG TPA: DPP IV N-terminal domain-containing protein [Candidatus Saccharimonadales bacterium]|nr:DPP IV N-terminal domain-containing protein [Candidatus Saccharimonadales bacterium]
MSRRALRWTAPAGIALLVALSGSLPRAQSSGTKTGAETRDVTLETIHKGAELGIRNPMDYLPKGFSWSSSEHLLAFHQKTDSHGTILVVVEPGASDRRIVLTGAQVRRALGDLKHSEKGVDLSPMPGYAEVTAPAPAKAKEESPDGGGKAAGKEATGAALEISGTEPPSIGAFSWLKTEGRIRFEMDGRPVVFDPGSYRLFEDPRPVVPGEGGENLERSRDGRYAAYTRDGDLFAWDFEDGKEVRLTDSGGGTILNGVFPWVYWEEMMWRTTHRAFYWRPQGDAIAYLQFDEKGVSTYPITDFSTQVPTTRMQSYPEVGTRNPSVRLGVVSLSSRETRWIDLGEPHEYLVYVTWDPDGSSLWVQALNRRQNRLRLYRIAAGETRGKMILEETSDTWVEPMDYPRFVGDGDAFVWPSTRSGFRHLYLCSDGGRKIAPLTSGDWEVEHPGFQGRSVFVDTAGRRVYYRSTEDSPLERQIYWVSLDGGRRHRLTAEPGTHSLHFSADGAYTVDSWSSLDEPDRIDVLDRDGRKVMKLGEVTREDLAPFRYGRPELLEIRDAEGTLFHASILKPFDFDPGRRYPVIAHVYGEPAAQVVRNAWVSPFQQVLANHGFLVFNFDGRGTPGRGRAFLDPIYEDQAGLPVQDWKVAVAYLKGLPYVNGDRLGVYGASGGGTMTLNLMLRSPGLFQAGAAISAVIDKKLYDTIYTERYLGLLDEDAEGYEKSSPLYAARDLQGELLIIHGLSDDNVHVQNVYNFLDALTKAGKDYDLYLYPPMAHGGGGDAVEYHRDQRVLDFFVHHLEPGADSASER